MFALPPPWPCCKVGCCKAAQRPQAVCVPTRLPKPTPNKIFFDNLLLFFSPPWLALPNLVRIGGEGGAGRWRWSPLLALLLLLLRHLLPRIVTLLHTRVTYHVNKNTMGASAFFMLAARSFSPCDGPTCTRAARKNELTPHFWQRRNRRHGPAGPPPPWARRCRARCDGGWTAPTKRKSKRW